MKPWESLTESGQIRRLRSLAVAALAQYAIAPIRLRLVGGFTNIIYRVDTSTATFALRVDLHQDHSDEDIAIELAWLEALATDTDLDVARWVPTIARRASVYASADGVPGLRRCVLFEWIPGKPLGDAPNEIGYHRLGRLSASLHLHGAIFTPPQTPMKWDRVFFWPEDIDPVVIFDDRLAHHFTHGRMQTIERALARTAEAFARLDPNEAQIVHGDLHPWNVHVSRSRLIGFDFEDVMWAHRVQDVGTTLMYSSDDPKHNDFQTAFTEGYSAVAPWPETYEGEMEHFVAARRLMFLNYVANIQIDLAEYYEIALPRIERYLSTWG